MNDIAVWAETPTGVELESFHWQPFVLQWYGLARWTWPAIYPWIGMSDLLYIRYGR